MATYTKVTPVSAFASSSYITYTPDKMIDGKFTTSDLWYSTPKSQGGVSQNQFVGLQFSAPVAVRKIVIRLFYWSYDMVIGYSSTLPGSQAAVTRLRTLNFKTKPTDDLGVTIADRVDLTFFVPDFPASTFLSVFPLTTASGAIGGVPAASDFLGVVELSAYTEDVIPPPTFLDGRNPRPPAIIPVSPFIATPQNWVRTEYATAGDFDFIPDPTTSLLYIVLQGGGGAGAVTRDMNWNPVTAGPQIRGGQTYAATSDGKVWSVDGGIGINTGVSVQNSEAPIDWVRTPISPAANSGSAVSGVPTAPAGGASALGVAGAAYQITPSTSGGNAILNFLQNNGSAQGLTVASQSGFVWYANVGWYSINRGETSSTGYVQFNPINLVGGQPIRFTYGVSSEFNYDKLTISVGGVVILTASGEASTFVDYVVPATGSYVIKFQYQKDNSVVRGSDYGYITAMTLNGGGYQPAQSGAAGRLLSGFVLPKPLTLHVGAGGVGIPSGQTITTAQHGTRGAGGAPGGNGGAGVIVVYEYKLQLPFETPKFPDMQFYNNATAELPGIYRTSYYGIGSNTKQNYVHKLRPRTKRVLVLLVGAGGGSCHWTDVSGTIYNSGPAIVSTGTKTITAESGGSSYKPDINSYIGGSGGGFTSDVEYIYSKEGLPGGWFGANSNTGRVTEFYGNYGNSSAGWPYASSSSGPLITASGGSGALGLTVLTESMIQSRELAIQVPGTGRGDYQAGTPGAVIIFETESTFEDVFASQVSELVLQRGTPYANTQVSQVNELVLQRDELAPNTQVSQVAFLVLQRSPTVAGTSVTEQTIEIIGRAEPANVRVSQSIQSVLVESEPPSQNVSQVAALVLIKENPTLLQMMDFGVMRFPMKNELYLSDICTVGGIGDGKSLRFQLEGDLPVGSTLIYNGADIQSLTVMIKDGDTLQLNSGVTNWFVTTIYVFVYVSRGDQIVREYAGFWSVLQATLSGRKRAIIGTLSSTRTIGLSKTGSAIGKNKAIAARSAKESKAVLAARRAIENVVKATVTAKDAKGNTVSTTVSTTEARNNTVKATVVSTGTKDNAVLSIQQTADRTVGESVLSNAQTAERIVGESVLSIQQTADRTVGESVLSTTQTSKRTMGKAVLSEANTFNLAAKSKDVKYTMFGGAYASGKTVKSSAQNFIHTYGEVVTTQPQKFNVRVSSPLLRFEMQALSRKASQVAHFTQTGISGNNITRVLTGVFYSGGKQGVSTTHTGYDKLGSPGNSLTDKNYVVFDYSKSTKLKVVEFLYNSKQASSFFRPGYVYTPTFIATNSPTIEFVDQQTDKVVYVEQQFLNAGNPKRELRNIGYVWVPAPNRDVGAKLHAVAAVSANTTYWGGLGWEGRHPPAYIGVKSDFAVRENARYTGIDIKYLRREFNRSSGLTQEFTVRINNSTLIHVQYLIRKTNIQLYGMRPMLYQAGKNRIDKAKYYMGFTTQAEVNAFIVNFLRPTTKLKLDGYVYRVGIDETLVCEIRGPNMPLAWLMRGG